MKTDFKMFDKVKIIGTDEIAYIVWFDEEDPLSDSFMLEIEGKEEMPKFYKRKDFIVIED